MTFDVSGRRVFLASPRGLELERSTCRSLAQEFNEKEGEAKRVAFYLHGWENIAGGVGRPQEIINQDIDQCDYMILILGSRWGSASTIGGDYTSGTEEEFYRCIDLLSRPEAHMRDVYILFKTVDPERLLDRGPQLQSVMDFRDSIEKSKELFYGVFDSIESFSAKIYAQLHKWSLPLSPRMPITMRALVKPLQGSVQPQPFSATPEQILEKAKEHAANGLTMQAEAAFAFAIKDNDPAALSEFALFMRRTGRVTKALEINQAILANPEIIGDTSTDAVSLRINTLANMGVIYRKQGNIARSIKVLHEAIQTAESSKHPVYKDLCYALDNYGLSLLRARKVEKAEESFERAHALRNEFGSGRDLAQSAANMGRRQLITGQFAEAEQYFSEAADTVGVELDQHLLANVLCGKAEAVLRQERTEGVKQLLDQAFAINISLGHSDGISITRSLFARLCIAKAQFTEAIEYATKCLEDNVESDNLIGQANGNLLLCLAYTGLSRFQEAQECLASAKRELNSIDDFNLSREVESAELALVGKEDAA
ncbi:tetratricopeptide repeat protein [Actinokineospora sp. PR83]|uniref:tetratricopeptide repeat protein n=1 Tax=Actinokineospora sp. PR83 TaxID=2884908 RepID=UPI001F15D821|nr:tetratricopeptide repeat protein [Actinokineospora sp. PR83]MCG8918593.1 tetratricopeptide repeat protein [Actinokineospora sp. PR83]